MRGLWRNVWTRLMGQNELFLEPAIKKAVCALLRAFVPNAEVWAYGSRISGKAHSGSDLDLVIRTQGALHQPCPEVDRLRTALRESDIPILIDVHDWALLPEGFQKEIVTHYILLQ